ncbi:YceI family protein [Kocuria palustris]|uniref:YceI family protein n=1 Tax=Kocuria palustris TaxID=71999 RepID=UPI0022FFCADC|nr:YceI family protein [Kocuria palustris]
MSAQSELTGTWSIDPTHSRVGFSSRHAMVTKVRGAFNDVSGTAQLDAEDMSRSQVRVVLQVASVDTRSPQRDAHLRSADFFDAQQHPTIEFDSTAVDEVDENQFIVTGELTIRGVTRTISVPLELLGVDTDPFGQLRAGLEGTRRIDRKDWGVSWNTPLDSGGVLVSDKITLEFELSLVKEAPAEAEPDQRG